MIIDYLDKLKSIDPEHGKELLAHIYLVRDDLLSIKKSIDLKTNEETIKNNYNEARSLLEMSADLHENIHRLNELIELSDNNEISSSADDSAEKESEKTKPDYELFSVDNTVEYDLDTQLTFKRPYAFSFKGKKYRTDTWSEMLRRICELLYEQDKTLFESMCKEPLRTGEQKAKFSKNINDLRRPTQISDSKVYVEMNLSAENIKNLIMRLLDKYHISRSEIKLFILRDYTNLHMNE